MAHPFVESLAGLPPGEWQRMDTLEPQDPGPVFHAFAAEFAARTPVLCPHETTVPAWFSRTPDRLLCADCLGAELALVPLDRGTCDACGSEPGEVVAAALWWPTAGFVAVLGRACLARGA